MMSLFLYDDFKLDAPEQPSLLEVILHLYPQMIRSRLRIAANEFCVNGAQRLVWFHRPWSVGLDTQTTCGLRDTKERISFGSQRSCEDTHDHPLVKASNPNREALHFVSPMQGRSYPG
jgi:hypothetical protein